jgi:hypothetical protein
MEVGGYMRKERTLGNLEGKNGPDNRKVNY